MSLPPINPKKSTAGIAVDPRTLERVVPESRRADGTVRKQLKIRPGYTPQEDVQRFRGTKQAQMDAIALPKGHIIGWVPPSAATSSKPMSKSAKKNAKRKEKRAAGQAESGPVPDNWDDDDEEVSAPKGTAVKGEKEPTTTTPTPKETITTEDSTKSLTDKMSKLDVKSQD